MVGRRIDNKHVHVPTTTRPSVLLALCLLPNLCILIPVSGAGIWHCHWTLVFLSHARTHRRACALCNSNVCLEALPGIPVTHFSSSVCLWSKPCLCVRLSDCVNGEAQRWTRSRAGVVTAGRPADAVLLWSTLMLNWGRIHQRTRQHSVTVVNRWKEPHVWLTQESPAYSKMLHWAKVPSCTIMSGRDQFLLYTTAVSWHPETALKSDLL